MSSQSRKHLILEIVAGDRTFKAVEGGFQGKCIHCNTRLSVTEDGDLVGKTTVEHIVPRTHGGTNTVDNLALACAPCNHEKGRRHDIHGPGHPGYEKMVAFLQARKLKRAPKT